MIRYRLPPPPGMLTISPDACHPRPQPQGSQRKLLLKRIILILLQSDKELSNCLQAKTFAPAGILLWSKSANLLHRCLIAEAVEHLLQTAGVKSNHHLVTNNNNWHRTPLGYFHHLLEGLTVLADIVLSKFNPFLRNELLRRMAMGSSGRSTDHYKRFCFHHRLCLPTPRPLSQTSYARPQIQVNAIYSGKFMRRRRSGEGASPIRLIRTSGKLIILHAGQNFFCRFFLKIEGRQPRRAGDKPPTGTAGSHARALL